MKLAVALLSGGLDSVTAACDAQADGYDIRALTVSYGQRHGDHEVEAARRIAEACNWPHTVVKVPIAEVSFASSLTDHSKRLPEDRAVESMSEGIPSTYVPMRNTMLIGLAAGLLESLVLGTNDSDMFGSAVTEAAVVIGANAVDYSGYPDCRPEYIEAMQRAVILGSSLESRGVPVKIKAPIIQASKADVIRHGHELGAPLHLTRSCYSGEAVPCGKCDSCLIRAKGFAEAGLFDHALDPAKAFGAR